MSIPRFFCFKDDIKKEFITLRKGDRNHIVKSLRRGISGEVEISDRIDTIYKTKISSVSQEEISLEILEKRKFSPKKIKITLFQSLLKGKKMDDLIKKTTELGVDEIIPVFSSRTIKKYDERGLKNKLKRWKRISLEASMQSHRDIPSDVKNPIYFDNLIDTAKKFDVFILTWRREKKKRISDIKFNQGISKIGYIIGPEGGFSLDEANLLISKGAISVSLGKNILRSETAAVAVMAILSERLFKH
jgi:16S rRNA (uracil1498-N3)-methyltransferase